MVYRFKPSQKKHNIREKKPYRRAGADSPRRLYGYRVDEVDLSALFELRKLEGTVEKGDFGVFFRKLSHTLHRAGAGISAFVTKTAACIYRGASRVWRVIKSVSIWIYTRARSKVQKRRAERKEVKDFSILAGALSAVLIIALLSAFAVLYKLILSDYFGSYEKITVPDMVGMSYADARASLDEENYNITVSYEYSPTLPAGSVMSQYPSGGAERKIFFGGSLPMLSIVVSRGKEMIEIKDFVGARARDAVLELKNSSLFVITIEDFSGSVPEGNVISTTPGAGEVLEAGGFVVLHVSRGQERVMLSVPDISGLTEAEATKKILASGFAVGKIDYKSSPTRAGLVISQGVEAHTELERGSKISFSVSAGQTFTGQSVPSLYGLTLDEARQKLAEVGLVLGNVYAAGSSGKKGTIIAQSPSASSAITSTLVSVDVYVSS